MIACLSPDCPLSRNSSLCRIRPPPVAQEMKATLYATFDVSPKLLARASPVAAPKAQLTDTKRETFQRKAK